MEDIFTLICLLILLIIIGFLTSSISTNVVVVFFLTVVLCVLILYCIVSAVKAITYNNQNTNTPDADSKMAPFDTETFPFPVYIIKKRSHETQDLIKQLESFGITNVTTWNESDEKLMYEKISTSTGWTLVLDGDVILHDNFLDLLSQYWPHISNKMDIIHIGHTSSHKYHKSQFAVYEESKIKYAYFISYKGASNLSQRLKLKSCILNGNHCFFGVKPDDIIDEYGYHRKYRGIAYKYR